MGTHAVTFESLLCTVALLITYMYKDTVMRQAVTPAECLAATLRFLATLWLSGSLLGALTIPPAKIKVAEACQVYWNGLVVEALSGQEGTNCGKNCFHIKAQKDTTNSENEMLFLNSYEIEENLIWGRIIMCDALRQPIITLMPYVYK